METRLLVLCIDELVYVSSDLHTDDGVRVADSTSSAAAFLDFVYVLHAGDNLTPDGVLRIQVGSPFKADEELAVCAIGRLSSCHADSAALEGDLVEFRRQILTRTTTACSGRIAGLCHESGDDTMEDNSIIKFHANQFLDSFDMLRSSLGEHLNDYTTVWQVHVQGVFLVHGLAGDGNEQGEQGR